MACKWQPKGTPSNEYHQTSCGESIEVAHNLVKFGATNTMGYYRFCPACGDRIQIGDEKPVEIG